MTSAFMTIIRKGVSLLSTYWVLRDRDRSVGASHLVILHIKQITLYQLATTDGFRRADRNYRNQLLALSLIRFGA